MSMAYLNGEFVNLQEAKVSVLDRGFLFGDSLYEVFPVYHGKPFAMDAHLDRLQQGLDKINLKLEQSRETLIKIINEVISKNNHESQYINIQVTRGVGEKRDHAMPSSYQPTLLVMAFPFTLKSIKEMSAGLTAVTVTDTRWQHCDIKATTLLANVMCLQEAKEKKSDEAILIRDNKAVEAISSNLFIVHKGLIKTPPLDNILAGITRHIILEIAKKLGLAHTEDHITLEELSDAEEIWLTGSVREIMPVLKLNDKPVGEGVAGPVWRQMLTEYRKLTMPSDTFMTFPCEHTFKVAGKTSSEFELAVLSIINKHATIPENGLDAILSKEGKYLSLSITIQAESKQQLDEIYRELSKEPLVLYAL